MSQSVTTDTVNDPSNSTTPSQTVKVVPVLKLDSRRFFVFHGVFIYLFPSNVFLVLRIIRLCQQQHGLRHGDYQRYR